MALLAALTAAGCIGGDDGLFVDVAPGADLAYIVGVRTAALTGHPMATVTGGVAVADYDNDGRYDLYVVDSGRKALYRNLGTGRFLDVTDGVGAGVYSDARQALFLDYDNDGWQDLFIVNFMAPNILFHNEGGRFRDVSEASGLASIATGHGAAAADYDRDGDLDILVANYGRWTFYTPEYQAAAENGVPNALYRNNGDGTFTDVTLDAGLTDHRWTFAVAFADYDVDGDDDVYVCNDFGFDLLYRNEGDGTFRDVTTDAGTLTNRNCMGATWADVDNDGLLDLFVTNIFVQGSEIPTFRGNNLWRNLGDGTFEDTATERGVADARWGWGSAAFDRENDGDLDLYVANGFVSRNGKDPYYEGRAWLVPYDSPIVERTYRIYANSLYNETHILIFDSFEMALEQKMAQTMGGYQRNSYFENLGEGRFADRSRVSGADVQDDSRAAANLDFDGDGDLDLAVTSFLRPLRLFENREKDRGAFLELLLQGTESNSDAAGAYVTMRWDGHVQAQERVIGSGFLSQSWPILHFGLDESDQADSVEVRWPLGRVDTFTNVAAGRYRLVEGTGELEPVECGAIGCRWPRGAT